MGVRWELVVGLCGASGRPGGILEAGLGPHGASWGPLLWPLGAHWRCLGGPRASRGALGGLGSGGDEGAVDCGSPSGATIFARGVYRSGRGEGGWRQKTFKNNN
eukprot:6671522-Pyramimonas_sp.AAC.1